MARVRRPLIALLLGLGGAAWLAPADVRAAPPTPERRLIVERGAMTLTLSSTPGALVDSSAPPPPPGVTPAAHPFLSGACGGDALECSRAGTLLRAAVSFDEYVRRLVEAGYEVHQRFPPRRPASLPLLRSLRRPGTIVELPGAGEVVVNLSTTLSAAGYRACDYRGPLIARPLGPRAFELALQAPQASLTGGGLCRRLPILSGTTALGRLTGGPITLTLAPASPTTVGVLGPPSGVDFTPAGGRQRFVRGRPEPRRTRLELPQAGLLDVDLEDYARPFDRHPDCRYRGEPRFTVDRAARQVTVELAASPAGRPPTLRRGPGQAGCLQLPIVEGTVRVGPLAAGTWTLVGDAVVDARLR